MPFIQPFHISNFYMLLALYSGPSVTQKNMMVWGLIQEKRKAETWCLFRLKDNVFTSVQHLPSRIQLSNAINCAKLSFWGLKSPKLLYASEWRVSDNIIWLNKAEGKGCWFCHLKTFFATVLLRSCNTSVCCNKDLISDSSIFFVCLENTHSKYHSEYKLLKNTHS